MQHTESSTKIYFAESYHWFRLVKGNRPISAKRVKKIENEVLNGIDMLRYCPIVCQEDFEDNATVLKIIDGQHRFIAARNLKSKVWYVIVKKFESKDIAVINSVSENWKREDYINFYIKEGNEHYIYLDAFIRTHLIPFSLALKMLESGTLLEGGLKDTTMFNFKKGLFKCNHKEFAEEFMKSLSLFRKVKFYKSLIFAAAIYKIIQANKIDIEAFAERFNNQSKPMLRETSTRDYLEELETMASIGSPTRIAIY